MPIEPQVFICYGRPDKDVAYAFAYEFWKNQVESYNYLAKPIENLINKGLEHRSFLGVCRLFIALLSPESILRYFVVEEITKAAWYAKFSGGRFCQCRAYVLTTTDPMESNFPPPDLLIKADRLVDVSGIVHELINGMGSKFVCHAQKSWTVNKGLYPDAWAALDAMYSSAPTPLPPIFTPGRLSVFGDEREPAMAEIKSLGRSRLNQLWLDVAERHDNLRRIYGNRDSFLEWNIQRDKELIETALRELDANGNEKG